MLGNLHASNYQPDQFLTPSNEKVRAATRAAETADGTLKPLTSALPLVPNGDGMMVAVKTCVDVALFRQWFQSRVSGISGLSACYLDLDYSPLTCPDHDHASETVDDLARVLSRDGGWSRVH